MINEQWKWLTNKILFPVFVQFVKSLPEHHDDGMLSTAGEFILGVLAVKKEAFWPLGHILNKPDQFFDVIGVSPVSACSSQRRLCPREIPAAPPDGKGRPLACRTRGRSRAQTPGTSPEPTRWTHNSRRRPRTPSWWVESAELIFQH